jgi:HlyD family secretion protein
MRLRIVKLVAAAAVLAAAAGALWYLLEGRNAGAEPKYRLARAERGPLHAVVVASGTLNAVTTVQVGSQISGQILEIHADFNTAVKKDQVIARIDPATFELRVSQARADLDAARSAVAVAQSNLAAQRAERGRVELNLAESERDLARKKVLVEKGFISPAELDKAKTLAEATREQLKAVEAQLQVSAAQVESARAAVKQREALLRQAEVDLERTHIRAPVDGTVILRNVDAGQTVAASLQAPVLFTIARDLRDMQVEAAIDEADVGRLRVGQAASFTVDAFPGRGFRGTITQIRKSPVTVQNVVSYTVIISASNPDQSLLPGMTANVRVVVDSRDQALRVPNAALRFRPPGVAEAKPAAENPAPQPGGGAAQQFRQRLYAELRPDATQKAKLDQIFDDARQKTAELREIRKDADRRKLGERLRAETRARVMEVLTEAQKPLYERLAAEFGGARAGGTTALGRVWVLDAGQRPAPVDVRIGLTDGTSTEVVEGPLREGDEVIVGVGEAPAPAKKLTSPGVRMF